MSSEKNRNWCTFANAAMSAFVPPISATFGPCRAFSSQHKENVAMAKKEAKKLDELFHDTLKDIYFAEKKILTTLPKMEKAAHARKQHTGNLGALECGNVLLAWAAIRRPAR